MKRYYLMIRFLPEQANLALLSGRCILTMHNFIYDHRLQGIGVTFPEWSDSSSGHTIAFVYSDFEVLNKLKKEHYFQDMQECGFFHIFDVTEVPENCPEVRFKRNQAIAKMFSGEIKRRIRRGKKRASMRGEVYTPANHNGIREFDLFHVVKVESNSNDNEFLLHIQKENVERKEEPDFNKYGFASNELHSGSVPDLSLII